MHKRCPTDALTDDELYTPHVLSRISRIAERKLNERGTMSNPAAVKEHLLARLRTEEREVFGVIFLDSQHRQLDLQILFSGTIDGASVYPREVIKATLALNAAAVILFHNHPSGEPEPSLADKQITRRLIDALALIDARVLDHIVTGSSKTVSFAERGLL